MEGRVTGMGSFGAEELQIQALMKEITELETAMRELLQSADKGIAATGTLLVAGLSAFVSQQLLIALIALPYALTATFFFMLQKYIDRQICAGRKRSLESTLNGRLGQELYQQAIVRDAVSRPDEMAGYLIYALGGLLALIASLWAVHEYRPPTQLVFLTNIWPLHIVGIVVCIVVLGVAARRMLTAEVDAYRRANITALLAPP